MKLEVLYRAIRDFRTNAHNRDVAFDINQGIENLKVQSAATRTEISATRMDVASIRADITRHQVDESRAKIIRWLSNVDPSSNHDAACSKHQAKTGEWLINHSAFEDWKSKKNSLLWLHGKRECLCLSICTLMNSAFHDRTSTYSKFFRMLGQFEAVLYFFHLFELRS